MTTETAPSANCPDCGHIHAGPALAGICVGCPCLAPTARRVDAEPFAFTVREGEPLTLETAVYEAIGAASVCWESMAGTGVFQEQRAREIGRALLDVVAERVMVITRRARSIGAVIEVDRMADECEGWSAAGTIGVEERSAWADAAALLRRRAAEIREGAESVPAETPGGRAPVADSAPGAPNGIIIGSIAGLEVSVDLTGVTDLSGIIAAVSAGLNDPADVAKDPAPALSMHIHDDHIHLASGVEQVGWIGQTGAVYALHDQPGTDREPGGYSPLYVPRDETCGHQIRDAAGAEDALHVGVLAILRHEGYNLGELVHIAAGTPTDHKSAGCEWESDHWLCETEDGKSRHPLEDHAYELAEYLRVALAAIPSGWASGYVGRDVYDQACNLVADMHAAAVGEVRVPARGVVEDIQDLATACRMGEKRWDAALKEIQRLAGLDAMSAFYERTEASLQEPPSLPADQKETPDLGSPVAPTLLLPGAVVTALKALMEGADYDTHKMLEGDESGVDQYPALAEEFTRAYEAALTSPAGGEPQ